jgi:hypothetical protein
MVAVGIRFIAYAGELLLKFEGIWGTEGGKKDPGAKLMPKSSNRWLGWLQGRCRWLSAAEAVLLWAAGGRFFCAETGG